MRYAVIWLSSATCMKLHRLKIAINMIFPRALSLSQPVHNGSTCLLHSMAQHPVEYTVSWLGLSD